MMSDGMELSDVRTTADRTPLSADRPRAAIGNDCRAFVRRSLRNVNVFVFFLCIYALVYGSLVTYLVAMITNIEKRFNIPSSMSGFVIGTTEIGYLVGVLPISHYGVKGHRPRILGVCGLLIAVSSFLWAMPFFIYGSRPVADFLSDYAVNHSRSAELCRVEGGGAVSQSPLGLTTATPASTDANIHVVLFFLFFGGVLNGIGCTPFFNIGVTFVDDHVSKVKSSAYFGLLFCVRTVAPVIGFLIGGALASVPEDVFGETTIGSEDPRFIGAWWLGFILLGSATAVTATPLLFFPRQLDKAPDIMDEEEEEKVVTSRVQPRLANKRFSVVNRDVETHRLGTKREAVASFLVALKRMLMNPAVVLLTVGAAIDYFTFSSFGTFLPKYMEVHFGRTASSANVVVGVVGALAAAMGTLLGGYAMSRYPMSLIRLVLYSSITLTVLTATSAVDLFLSCPQLPLAGAAEPGGGWNFTSACSAACGCAGAKFQPVCGSDRRVYLSPCAAGCLDRLDRQYSSCHCLFNGTGSAEPGLCAEPCEAPFYAYIVISFFLNFLSNICYMPFCMASLRCVHENDKSLAMALLSFLSSLLGIGGASIFGVIIDKACLLTSAGGSGQGRGGCALYDRAKFRYLFNGLPLIFRVPSVIMFFLTFVALKRNVFMQINEVEIKKDKEKRREKRTGRI